MTVQQLQVYRTALGYLLSSTPCLVMLLHSEGVRVSGRQELLQVVLDVVPCANLVQQVNHADCVVLPIGCPCHFQIVGTPTVPASVTFRGKTDYYLAFENGV
jgi:hypothetical protein